MSPPDYASLAIGPPATAVYTGFQQGGKIIYVGITNALRRRAAQNHTERSLRGLAIGRHNWTFVGSDRGGRTMAVLRSFVASCELANVDPFAWFQDVLSRIGSHSIQQLDELLPHRWAAARP